MKPTLLLCRFTLLLAISGFSRQQAQPPPASPPYTLSDHPKASGHVRSPEKRPFKAVQDIDSSGRQSTFRDMANVLNNQKKQQILAFGTTGMVAASHSGGHACSSRNHQHLPEGGRSGSVAAGRVGSASRFKTGHRGDHRLWRGLERPATQDRRAGSR